MRELPEEAHAVGDALRSRAFLEVRPDRAVSGDHQGGVGGQLTQGVDRILHAVPRSECSHEPEHDRVPIDAVGLAGGRPGRE